MHVGAVYSKIQKYYKKAWYNEYLNLRMRRLFSIHGCCKNKL